MKQNQLKEMRNGNLKSVHVQPPTFEKSRLISSSRDVEAMDMHSVCFDSQQSSVVNFRSCADYPCLYRSGGLDRLGEVCESCAGPLHERDVSSLEDSELFLLFDATLVLDLRMDGEIDSEQLNKFLRFAPGGRIKKMTSVESLSSPKIKRQHYQPSGSVGLTKSHLLSYACNHWAPDPNVFHSADVPKMQDFLMKELNKRGLVGLYEIILETKAYICAILQAITLHLEQNPSGKVVFYCSIGKDRTGIVSMLALKILGHSNSEAAEDFALSSSIFEIAKKKFAVFFKNKVDETAFATATTQTMFDTIGYLENRYGSVEEYLTSTGFHSSWQARFRAAVLRAKQESQRN